jgi:ABC-2 type transport system permease protein
MTALAKMTLVEAKLLFREPATWIIALVLPTFIVLVLGAVFAPHRPEEAFGGQRFIDLFVPSMVVLTLATLGVSTLPIRLATYREKGVLRRLSTTPVHPGNLLAAQLIINIAIAVGAVLLLVVAGRVAFDVPLPRHPIGFIAAFLVGTSSLFALGVLVAARASSARTGTALAMPIFFLVMFVGGVYLPRVFLPEFVVRIGEVTPPGVQALLDAWMGTAPQPLQLAIMAAITVIAGVAAARLFKWE